MYVILALASMMKTDFIDGTVLDFILFETAGYILTLFTKVYNWYSFFGNVMNLESFFIILH